MPTLPITKRQATFLNRVADAAKEYRRSCDDVMASAEHDLRVIASGHKPSGPNHQTLFELTKFYGELNALLGTVWLVFDISAIEDPELKAHQRDSINEWVTLATVGVEDNDFSVWFEAE